MPHGHSLARAFVSLALISFFVGSTALAGVVEAWVDANSGSDLNPGSEGSPYKTITHAIGQVGLGGTINVNPGIYDAALGETFPITLADSQRLLGDLADRGEGTTPTVLSGIGAYATPGQIGEQATVIAAGGSEISGFRITAPSTLVGHAAVMIDDVTCTVSENTFAAANYAGVFVWGTGDPTIANNRFDSGSYGLWLQNSTGTPLITGNVFGAVALQIDLRGASPHIANNEFLAGSQVGVQILGGSPRIEGNTFRSGGGIPYGGIRVANPVAFPVSRSNTFENALGVLIADGNIDLGLSSEFGLNDFSGVVGVSIQHDGDSEVSAYGNSWPNDPPIYGVDIVLNGSGAVLTVIVPTEQVSVGSLKAKY